MANKVEIIVDFDPGGKGEAEIKRLASTITALGPLVNRPLKIKLDTSGAREGAREVATSINQIKQQVASLNKARVFQSPLGGGIAKDLQSQIASAERALFARAARSQALGTGGVRGKIELAAITRQANELKNLREQLRGITGELEGVGRSASSASIGLKGIAGIIAGTFIAGLIAVKSFASESISAFNQLRAAQLGLSSIATFRGLQADQVTSVLQNLDLVKSGLLNVADASTTLRNFLTLGFSLQESVNLLKAFADSAAFGRQASLSFGDAVRSASEGVRIGSSILLNNAGIIQNLDTSLGRAGFRIDDLTDKVKGAAARQTLYNSILEETLPATGNATKLSGEFAGQQAKLDATWTRLLQTVGAQIAVNPELNRSFGEVGNTLEALIVEIGQSGSSLNTFIKDAVSNFAALTSAAAGVLNTLREISGVIEFLARAVPGGSLFFAGGDFRNTLQGTKEEIETAKKTAEEFAKLREKFVANQKAGAATADITKTAKAKTPDQEAKEFEQTLEKIERFRKTTGDTLTGFIGDIRGRVLSDNPFVQLFQKGEDQLNSLLEKLAFVPGALDVLRRNIQTAVSLEAFKLDISRVTESVKLRGEATALGKERGFENAQLDARLRAIGFEAEARAIRRGEGVDQQAVILRQIQELFGRGLTARDQAQRVADLTSGLSQEDLFNTRVGRFRAEALFTLAQSPEEDPRLKIAREQLDALNNVRNQFDPGSAAFRAAETAAREKLLAITGELQPSQLSPELRESRIKALLSQAEQISGQRAEAESFQRETLQSQNALTKSLTELTNQLGTRGIIEIINRAGDNVSIERVPLALGGERE